MQALVVKPGAGPSRRLPGTKVATPLLHQQAEQSPIHVVVQLTELDGRVPGAEVVAPAPKEPVEAADDHLQLLSDLASRREDLDPRTGTLHRPRRRPAVEVITDFAVLLPHLAGHARPKVKPEEV